MALSILNNISSLMAENQLNITNNNLQTTLFQLSSGSRINTGADDPAGLAIADGLNANIMALNQSVQNANDGIGTLQVADGALSQVTSLLDRAVTLATEASNGGLSTSQADALQNEFSSIQSEITQIGTNTTYNGTGVFTGDNLSIYMSDGSAADEEGGPTISITMPTLSTSALNFGTAATGTLVLSGNPSNDDTVTIGTTTYTFVTGTPGAADEVAIGNTVQDTLTNLEAAVNGNGVVGTQYGTGTVANAVAQITSVNAGSAEVQATTLGLGNGTTTGNSVALAASLTGGVGGWANGATTLSGGAGGVDLNNTTDAQSALTAIESAIASVASDRGNIGAGINRLNAAVSVMNTQVQNLTSGESAIKDADVGTVVANLSKYQVLEQTGIAALAQANTNEQAVLKLLQ
jgi:flagellin